MTWEYEGVIAGALLFGAWAVAGFWSPWVDRFAALAVVIVGLGTLLLSGAVA
jgi:hypothetical protein